MVIASALGVELITAALYACAGLLLCRCLTPQDAMVHYREYVYLIIK